MISRAIPLLVVSTILLSAPVLRGQSEVDPERHVREMLAPFDTTDLARAGRTFIIHRIERESVRWIPEVVDHVDRRLGRTWLPPRVRTLLLMLTEQTDELTRSKLADEPDLLSGRTSVTYTPDPTEQVRDYARRHERQILRFLSLQVEEDRHASFLLLLYESLTIRGVRGVDDLNDRIDAFAAADSTDPRSVLARTYLRRELVSEPFGIGLAAGYDAGSFVADGLLESVAVHGPRLGTLLWSGSLHLELAALVRSIEWSDQHGTTVEFGGSAGIDLMPGSLHLAPLLGLRYWVCDVDGQTERLLTPSVGLDFGTRVLFDDPPHLQLSVGGEWHLPSITSGAGRFYRSSWSIRFTLALISRSYRIE